MIKKRRPGAVSQHMGRLSVAGVPGLEPRLTEPESVGLPITLYPTGHAASELPDRADVVYRIPRPRANQPEPCGREGRGGGDGPPARPSPGTGGTFAWRNQTKGLLGLRHQVVGFEFVQGG